MIGYRPYLSHARATVLAFCLALTALVIVAYATDALESTELSSVDARFGVRGERPSPKSLVFVPIDDVTFDELGMRWPFARSVHARVVDELRMAGARVIAYDVQFTEPSDPEEDNALITAVGRAGNVVLATTETNERGESRVFGGPEVVRSVRARSGHTLLPTDANGVIRRFTRQVDGLDGFAVAVVERATGRRVDRELFADGPAWIDFGGPPGHIAKVPFSRVYRGKADRERLRGKVVVVGASAPSLHDLHSTSVDGQDLMPGPEIQAHAIQTLLDDIPLRSAPRWLDVALIFALGMLAPLVAGRLSPFRTLAAALLAAAVFLACAQLAFNTDVVVPVFYPLLALGLSAIGTLALSYLTTSLERVRIREYFGRYVPRQVVDEVLEHVSDDLRLGGVRRQSTVMFTDLRGFTSFAEDLEPEQVIETLNRYLTTMSDAILDHGGTLISYMGDGIMAVFGAPIAQDDHADRGLACACQMLDECLPAFNDWIRSQGLGEGFRMGIGLNSGTVMSGNVGSERRLEYTAIGDTTNTAARLEAMTKGSGHQLLIADATRTALTGPAPELVYVDEVPVRGRHGIVKVWSLNSANTRSTSRSTADAIRAAPSD